MSEPVDIELVTADTGRTPDEGFTAGSQSMQNSGTAIRHAAAQVRAILFEEASRRFNVAAAELQGREPDRRGSRWPVGRLRRTRRRAEPACGGQPQSSLKPPDALRLIGKTLRVSTFPAR